MIYLTDLNIFLFGQLLQINIKYATLFFILKILCGIAIFIILMLFFALLFRTIIFIRGKFSDEKNIVESNASLLLNSVNVVASYDFKLSELYLKIGLFHFCIYKHFLKRDGKVKTAGKPSKSKKEKSKKKFTVSMFSVREWIGLGREAAARFFRILQKDKFAGKLRIGLGNPASTGFFMGAYYLLKSLIPDFKDVSISPNFIQKEVKGEISLDGSIRLIKLIPMVIFVYRKMLTGKKRLKARGKI